MSTVSKPRGREAYTLSWRRMVFTLALLWVWGAGRGRGDVAAAAPFEPSKAPEFVRTELAGKKLDLAAYRGKVVLLNFWATWCVSCELEMPSFVRWQSRYGARGLQVIGISMDDDPRLARRAYGKLKLNYPVAMGDAELGELYGGILGLPVTYLIDSGGEIRAKFEGDADLREIEEQLVSLLPRR